MSRADAGLALLRALATSGPRFTLETMESRPWASATFAGERHAMRIEAADDPALSDWLAGLAEADLRLAGHLLADIAVGAVRRQGGRAAVEIEALTLVEN